MTDFYKMTPNAIRDELERFTMQLIHQRDEQGIKITEKQMKRWNALQRAYKAIWNEVAK